MQALLLDPDCKNEIGRFAAESLQSSQSVIFDSGSACKLQEIDEVISNDGLSHDTLDQLRVMGIRLSLAGDLQ